MLIYWIEMFNAYSSNMPFKEKKALLFRGPIDLGKICSFSKKPNYFLNGEGNEDKKSIFL